MDVFPKFSHLRLECFELFGTGFAEFVVLAAVEGEVVEFEANEGSGADPFGVAYFTFFGFEPTDYDLSLIHI